MTSRNNAHFSRLSPSRLSRQARYLGGLLVILSVFSIPACSTVGYYGQAISGQLEILNKREPIPDILQDPQSSPKLKAQLAEVLKIRQFASETLHLPDNPSYTHYVDLERPYVVWSVFATPNFSMTPKTWCFPLVGCVGYRGYFSEAAAQRSATKLRATEYDVYVARVAAYSTLGWFSDPVLNTILDRPLPHIAGLIFHELAHQQLYIKDDTFFNEAFAVAVEKAGVKQWLAAQGDESGLRAYQAYWQRRGEFTALVLGTKARLETLYQQALPTAEMQAGKATIFADLRADYNQLKTEQWQGFAGYDSWFKDVNNAKLSSVATYHALVPNFEALLADYGEDFPAFYAAVAALGKLPYKERHAQLKKWSLP